MFGGRGKGGKAAPAKTAGETKALPAPSQAQTPARSAAAGDDPSIDDQIEQALASKDTRNAANKIKSFADQSEQNLQMLANAIRSLLREGHG